MAEYTTKDGVTVRPGDAVYHPSYYPTAYVQKDGTARIPAHGIEPVGECYSRRKAVKYG